ncbi:uncharacterized protein BN801_01004 [Mycoplasma sp. CAG:877]|nr:uncharacterized protein BN801_01004 [Mycoplasma sp. CAG:877]
MKTLRKIFIVLLEVVLVCLMVVFILSFSVRDAVVKQMKNVTVENVREEIISDVDSNINDESFNELVNNTEADALIQKYIDLLISGMAGNNIDSDINIDKDVITFIDNNKDLLKEKLGVSDEQLEEFKKSENLKKANDYFKEKVQEGNESNKSVVTTFRIYNNLISDSLRIILVISIVVLIVIIGILKNSLLSLIKIVGIDLVITAILSIIVVAILNFIIISVADLAITVNYSYGLIYGIVALVIGIIMIVSSNIYKKKMS